MSIPSNKNKSRPMNRVKGQITGYYEKTCAFSGISIMENQTKYK